MSEGSLEAPIRHPLAWQDESFYDEAALDEEMRRIFDICHGCRRCFNLCESFPRLFDLIDDSKSGELDTVDSKDFKSVVSACTLCDMCFLTKCPYVPPHEFNIDFPHLMLRYRALQLKKGEISNLAQRLTETDKNGKLGCSFSSVANWASKRSNAITRPVMESVLKIDRNATLPKFEKQRYSKTLSAPAINKDAPAYGRKAVIFATCFAEYNNADIGHSTNAVLAKNGVRTVIAYPSCCGMPQLEHGDLKRVAANAEKTATELHAWVEKGYDVIAPVPSCALMLKFEWPLILPENKKVKILSEATFDISEYITDIAKKDGLADGLKPLGKITLHISCHSRAQNMGQKGAEMLRAVPDTEVTVIERCSGHGGSWGVMKENFKAALKVGKPVARQAEKALKAGSQHIVSECPLAREHILQGIDNLANIEVPNISSAQHPIQLLARAYGF